MTPARPISCDRNHLRRGKTGISMHRSIEHSGRIPHRANRPAALRIKHVSLSGQSIGCGRRQEPRTRAALPRGSGLAASSSSPASRPWGIASNWPGAPLVSFALEGERHRRRCATGDVQLPEGPDPPLSACGFDRRFYLFVSAVNRPNGAALYLLSVPGV